MFTCTMGKGFQIRFQNGWSISVQWGPGNYCENCSQDHQYLTKPASEINMKSLDAECAVFDPLGVMVQFPGSGHDTVRGHMDSDQVFALMEWVKAR